MYLEVSPAGGKAWRLKYRFHGLEKRLSLGSYPEVTLKEARAKRKEAKRLLSKGIDPAEQRRAERDEEREARAREAAETRFLIDSKGALLIQLGRRRVKLTNAETADLRTFLQSTQTVNTEE